MQRTPVSTALGMLVVAGLAALIVSEALAQGGRSGPQGAQSGELREMMGSVMYLERSWTAVSFQLDCTGAQLEQLRPTYRNTLSARDAALKQAMANGDREAAAKAMVASKTRLETKLKSVLSDAQWNKLQQLMKPPMGPGRPTHGAGGR